MPRSLLPAACAALLFAGPLFVACGGMSAPDNAKEIVPTGGSTSETAAASAEPSATAEAAFMRVGDVTVAAAEAPAASAAPTPPPPPTEVDPKHGRKSLVTGGGGPQTASDGPRGNEKKGDAEGGGEPPPKPTPGAAVVDSSGNLTEAEVRATIVQKQSAFRECYDLGLQSAPSFSGTVQLRVSIGPTGAVASCEVLSSTTKVVQVDSCVLQAVRRIQFPAKGNGAVVAFPIEFGR